MGIDLSGQLALVGFMGTGKSTVGSLLAAELGWPFFDLDLLISARAGRSIPLIFREEGEAGFRRREKMILTEVAGRRPQVLATGGGIVMDRDNVKILKANGHVVALVAPWTELCGRLQGDRGRPMLAGADPDKRGEQLWVERDPFYRRAADLVVETAGDRPEAIAGRIAAWYWTLAHEGGSHGRRD